MFRKKASSPRKQQQPQGRDPALTNFIGVIAEEKADDEDMHGKALAQELFEQIQHETGKSELDLEGFKNLIKLVDEKGVLDQIPDDADLEKAYLVADTDKNGVVDLHEFMVLFELIQEGLVQGLGRKTWKLATSTKEMQELKQKREQFRENLEKKREARASIPEMAEGDEEEEEEEEEEVAATPAEEPPKKSEEPATAIEEVPETAPGSTTVEDNDDVNSQHSSEAGSAITDDSANTSVDRKRGKRGTSKGRLVTKKNSSSGGERSGTSIPRSSTSRPRPTDNNESVAEQQIRSERNARKDTGEALTNAKTEWENRSKVTKSQDIGNLGKLTTSSSHQHDEINADTTSAAELAIRSQKNARKETGEALTNAKTEWESRSKVTKSQDIGNLGKLTASSSHQHDEINADTTSAAEMAIRSQKNARKETSETLSSAKSEWEKRGGKTTKARDIGNLAKGIESQSHTHEEMTVDNTSHAEMAIRNQKNARKETSETLSSAKSDWEKRSKVTKSQDIGNLAKGIESQSHTHDEMTVDNTSHAEMAIRNQKNARKETSETLSSAKSEWEKRGGKTTKARDIGNLGAVTKASSRRQDEMTVDNTSTTEHIQKMRKDARMSMSEELKKNKDAFNKRMQSAQEKAIAKFEAADTDGNGTLDLEELRAAAPRLKIEADKVDEVFATIDSNGDGVISVEEFTEYFGKQQTATALAQTARFSTHTASSMSSKYETSAEQSNKNAKDIRNGMSSALSDANKEWQTRQAKSRGNISPAHKNSEDKAIAEAREELLKRTIQERKASQVSDDDSGTLTLKQLKEAAPHINMSVEEIEVIFKKVDKKKTGFVQVDEFMSVYGEMNSSSSSFVTKAYEPKAAAPTKSSQSAKFNSERESKTEGRNELSSISSNASKDWQKRQAETRAELLKRAGGSKATKEDFQRRKSAGSPRASDMPRKGSFGNTKKPTTPSKAKEGKGLKGKEAVSKTPEKEVVNKKKMKDDSTADQEETEAKAGPLWFVPTKVAFWRGGSKASNDGGASNDSRSRDRSTIASPSKKTTSPAAKKPSVKAKAATSPPPAPDSPATAYKKKYHPGDVKNKKPVKAKVEAKKIDRTSGTAL